MSPPLPLSEPLCFAGMVRNVIFAGMRLRVSGRRSYLSSHFGACIPAPPESQLFGDRNDLPRRAYNTAKMHIVKCCLENGPRYEIKLPVNVRPHFALNNKFHDAVDVTDIDDLKRNYRYLGDLF